MAITTKEYIGKTDLLYIFGLLKTEFDKYVLAVNGKGLSTEDFTSELLAKLNAIEDDAQANVQADWNEANTASDSYIKNKPTIPDAQIQSDWNQTVTTALDYIKNKPNMEEYAKLVSPNFTGTPTAPTATAGTNTTQIASTAFVVTAIANALAQITGIRFDGPYASLAALQLAHPTGENGVIYLVNNGGAGSNTKDEYFWDSTNSKYELFGSTAIDLSNYLQDGDVVELSTDEVKAAWDSKFSS